MHPSMLAGVHLVYKALVVRDGVVSRRVGVYCMYWTTARHKPLSLALPICTLTDGPEWLIDALTCHSIPPIMSSLIIK